MSEVTSKFPQLRFPEFSGEWKNRRLDEIFYEIKDKVGNQNIETFSISAGKGFISQRKKFGRDISGQQNKKYIVVHPNQFSYNKGNSKTFKYGCVYPNNTNSIIAVPNVFISFKLKDSEMSVLFFAKIFENHHLDRGLRRIISSSARMDGLLNVNKKYFFELTVPVTTKPEQQKIAAFLTAVDNKIEQLSKKKELLGEYKKGLMQQIFSQAIRFKADDGSDFPDWKEKKLGSLCEITTGKLDANAMVKDGQYRFYTCAKEYYKIDDYAFDTDALIVSGNGANVGYIHHYQGKFNAYQRTYVLDSFTDNIVFVKFVLDGYLHKRIMKEKNEGNTPYIVMGTLTDMKINLPSFSEQTKISNFLSSIDNKIEQVGKQLDESKQFKKALLQQMFV